MAPRSPTHRAFGQAIREIRHERGLSQERLADESDLDRTLVGKVERGEGNPSFESLLKIAAALGVRPSTLFERFERNSGT